MSDFQTFVAQEHQKRVKHFINFCTTEKRAPKVADAVHIFGFCARDAKPIVEDAIKQMAAA